MKWTEKRVHFTKSNNNLLSLFFFVNLKMAKIAKADRRRFCKWKKLTSHSMPT